MKPSAFTTGPREYRFYMDLKTRTKIHGELQFTNTSVTQCRTSRRQQVFMKHLTTGWNATNGHTHTAAIRSNERITPLPRTWVEFQINPNNTLAIQHGVSFSLPNFMKKFGAGIGTLLTDRLPQLQCTQKNGLHHCQTPPPQQQHYSHPKLKGCPLQENIGCPCQENKGCLKNLEQTYTISLMLRIYKPMRAINAPDLQNKQGKVSLKES
jgi:hypothetical protein